MDETSTAANSKSYSRSGDTEMLDNCDKATIVGFIGIVLVGICMFFIDGTNKAAKLEHREVWCAYECGTQGTTFDQVTDHKVGFGGSILYTCWCDDHTSRPMP